MPFDSEAWLANQLRVRVHERNLNAIIGFFGLPGTGKSYSALRLAQLLSPEFTVNNVYFDVRSYLSAINAEPPRGTVMILDDAGVAANSRKWQSDLNQTLSLLGQSFRFMGYVSLITCPDIGMLDSQFRSLFHVTLDTERIDHDHDRAILRPRLPKPRLNPKLWPYPQAFLDGQRRARLVQIAFRMPDKALSKQYEERRAAFMKGLYRQLEDSLAGGKASRVPKAYFPALIELSKTHTQREMAALLGVDVAQVNRDLKAAKAAVAAALGKPKAEAEPESAA